MIMPNDDREVDAPRRMSVKLPQGNNAAGYALIDKGYEK